MIVYNVEPEIFEAFPNFRRGVVIARSVNNAVVDDQLDEVFRKAIERVAASSANFSKNPAIKAWTDVYESISAKKRIKPSVLKLIQRIEAGAQIPFINRLVCISNIIALTYFTPCGVIDTSKIGAALSLQYANGGECFEPIGSAVVDKVQKGEIILSDEFGSVLCRTWNSRGGRSGMIDDRSINVLFDVDVLLDSTEIKILREAQQCVATLVSNFCSGECEAHILSPTNMSLVL